MTFFEFIKSRRRKAALFFLAGFFSGGILYYLCREPAGDALAALEENMLVWASGEQDFFQALFFILWERGKVFCVLWRDIQRFTRLILALFLFMLECSQDFFLLFLL